MIINAGDKYTQSMFEDMIKRSTTDPLSPLYPGTISTSTGVGTMTFPPGFYGETKVDKLAKHLDEQIKRAIENDKDIIDTKQKINDIQSQINKLEETKRLFNESLAKQTEDKEKEIIDKLFQYDGDRDSE